MSQLTNRAAVRRYILDYAARTGRGDVIRAVSEDVFYDLDATIRKRLRRLVDTHPSRYRTLKP